MKLSLSGRVVESGGGTILPVGAFLDLARRSGYEAVDLRASQFPPQASPAECEALRTALLENDLAVSETAWRGELTGDDDLERFTRFVRRCADLDAHAIRMAGGLAELKRAAQLAAAHDVLVVYQMHTGGAFETVSASAAAVEEIGEPNFGVLVEPANLLLAGQKFSRTMFEPLAGRVFGVHVQTLEVHADAPQAVRLADGREVRYRRVPYHRNRQIDFETFFAALRHVGFDGFVNELEPCPGLDALEETVRRAAAFLRPLLR